MLITQREKDIVEKQLTYYNSIKNIIEKMEFKTLKEAEDFLKELKDTDVYNLDEFDGYIDFYYKDLSLCINDHDDKIQVCDCISVWDKEKQEYIFECHCLDYIQENLNKDKYEMIKNTLERMKDNETKGLNNNYYKEELKNFIEKAF